jgi:hypothetical protein
MLLVLPFGFWGASRVLRQVPPSASGPGGAPREPVPGGDDGRAEAPAPAAPVLAPAEAAAANPAALAAQAKAVFSLRCFECHGKDPARTKKKLNVLDHSLLVSPTRKLVVPGSPQDSLLLRRVEDPDEPMPPEGKPPMPAAERALLRAWIAAGAPDFSAVKPEQLATAPAPGRLEARLREEASEVLALLRQKGCRTVGVLKFRVQPFSEVQPTDHLGPLNMALADRLELALLLANDEKNPIGIIRSASAVASLIPAANHLLVDGRLALFGPKYPLAWGKDDALVTPDAFLTGAARFSPDLRRLGITIVACLKDANTVYAGTEFFVDCDAELLIEAGESYLLPGAFKEPGPLSPAAAVQASLGLWLPRPPHSPLVDAEAPVVLEARYGGHLISPRFQDGRFTMPAPKGGEQVLFTIKRQTALDEWLGVVFKVNGESTLFRETLPDAQCRKWVLKPGVRSLTIDHVHGDIPDDKGPLQVRALPPSKPGQFNYSPDVGTVSLVVFREAKNKGAEPGWSEDQAVVARVAYPKDRVADLAALKALLRKEATPANAARGLLVPARPGDAPSEVEFRVDPTPVMAVTIVCERP